MMRLSIGCIMIGVLTMLVLHLYNVEIQSLPMLWSKVAEPGPLSRFHAKLKDNCQNCHNPYTGISRDQCVTCHASNSVLLGKQNTAFHGSISSCTGCHFEHLGESASITKMDHTHLTFVAKNMQIIRKSQGNELISFLRSIKPDYHESSETMNKQLDCASCHSNQDRHRSLFGSDCSTCHNTSKWSIGAFRHPSPNSRECSQCHQAPPSHYMMHFEMVSKKVAGIEHAEVRQCYLCHQTTSWNDIKGIGWYKHH